MYHKSIKSFSSCLTYKDSSSINFYILLVSERHLILAANGILKADIKDPTMQPLGADSLHEAFTAPATSRNPPEAKQPASGPSAWKRITTFYKTPAPKKIIQPLQIRFGEFHNIFSNAKSKILVPSHSICTCRYVIVRELGDETIIPSLRSRPPGSYMPGHETPATLYLCPAVLKTRLKLH